MKDKDSEKTNRVVRDRGMRGEKKKRNREVGQWSDGRKEACVKQREREKEGRRKDSILRKRENETEKKLGRSQRRSYKLFISRSFWSQMSNKKNI